MNSNFGTKRESLHCINEMNAFEHYINHFNLAAKEKGENFDKTNISNRTQQPIIVTFGWDGQCYEVDFKPNSTP